ncbi:hypothetical protein [Rugosimonospora africana]|uniref:Uncharacterized protein n=1 Tax=Rugosimonospora africana TaxID=556532 RepID=A0A8J3QWF1_9ACTN|nr:hypothetical protein [Rugosimonospora africana]GIH17063.1 hypothetical protein Raf01_52350 [Rugosimonospora africana]
MSDTACGTAAGYLRHRWQGTPTCPACLAAWHEFDAWCRDLRAGKQQGKRPVWQRREARRSSPRRP